MTAEDDLEFLRNFQQLLDEGSFVSTYKLALLQALADLSVEREIDRDGRLHVPISAIAGKFVEYYWRQALPYRTSPSPGFGRCCVNISTIPASTATAAFVMAASRTTSSRGHATRWTADDQWREILTAGR